MFSSDTLQCSLSEAKSSLGSASNKSDYDRSQISLKADYHATTNSKIYFKYVPILIREIPLSPQAYMLQPVIMMDTQLSV